MWGFLVGAAVGAAGWWAFKRYALETIDEFGDFETSAIDRPTTSDPHGRPTDAVPGSSEPGAANNLTT